MWRVHHDELGVRETELVHGRCARCERRRCGAIENEQTEPGTLRKRAKERLNTCA